MRILIADDNALIRTGLAEIIADNAWEVCGQASNGTETLQQARTLRPDVLLVDISMPGMNGLEIAAAIKREMPEIKVLIVSQHDFDQVLGGARRKLADGFIDKTRVWKDLVPTITIVLAKV